MASSHEPLGPGCKEKSFQSIDVVDIFQAPSVGKNPCQKVGGGQGSSIGKKRQKPIVECKQDKFFFPKSPFPLFYSLLKSLSLFSTSHS